MRLTRSKSRNLRKKMRTQNNAENIFIITLMNMVSSQLKKFKLTDNNYSEFEKALHNLSFKKLPKLSKVLGRKILKKNKEGFEGIMSSLLEGLTQTKKKKNEERLFKQSVNSLAKEEKFFGPILEKFNENVNKIKDVPMELTKILRKAYLNGEGLRGTEFEKLVYERMKKRAKLIVRTESSKINAAFTEVRAKALNIKGYIWSSSGDKRVRDSHNKLDGVLIFWNDPPTFRSISKKGNTSEMVGNAGEFPNCRCVSLPVFELEDISFPIKVAERAILTDKYVGKNKYNLTVKGIRTYTKAQFIEKFGTIIKR